MTTVAFYDAKPYDRQYFERAPGAGRLRPRFHEFRLVEETADTAAGAQAVCIFVNDRLTRPCLEVLHRAGVRLIALRCAGFDNVDIDVARKLGLVVTYVPAYSPHAIAEHTIGLLLTLNRKIHHAYNRTREHNFSLNGFVGFDICGKTVGIIGAGRIGRIVAQIFRGFEARVIACDLLPSVDWAKEHGVTYADFDTVLTTSDILTLHVPLTPDTLYMLNEQTLSRMKAGSYLINTSRGKLIDTSALLAALKNDHLGGVALDVYEKEAGIFFENLSGGILHDDELSRLLTSPKVLVTSHQGFLTHEALTEIAHVTTSNLLTLETGEPFLEGTTLSPASR
ncbi:2-hydroxyacid dehydrogenase [Nitrosospira sp. NpAV]|uniref:2-hydroxyacid dehydrogenase n=1 Tax=Nitrosospira sp. NpAV TaxID=58133 RepID=UPI0005A0C768|nr:2-hydroxyacid dehydrogenase [Nitrosospira sp. NpAV]KIO49861.1 2-hydroxyacid dehydrogenase [Nitrosospira sp. NpAV]